MPSFFPELGKDLLNQSLRNFFTGWGTIHFVILLYSLLLRALGLLAPRYRS
ncbi:hypothetical protein LEP1GSC192_2565 [Leptospira sp. B5-022]|nr:hypothetical protein LEP1GSC192_2565 [Leptospira sp. B5-022]